MANGCLINPSQKDVDKNIDGNPNMTHAPHQVN